MEKIQSSIKTSFKSKKENVLLISLGVVLLLISFWLIYVYASYYENRFYPKIYVDQINISGLSKEEAQKKLETYYRENSFDLKEEKLSFYYDDLLVQKSLEELNCQSNFEEILDRSFAIGHEGKSFAKVWDIIKTHWQVKEEYLQMSCDQKQLEIMVNELKNSFDIEGASASAELIYSGNPGYITINPGKDGRKLLAAESLESIQTKLKEKLVGLEKKDLEIKAIIASTSAQLEKDEINEARKRVSKFVGEEIIFKNDYQKYRIDDKTLVSFIAIPDGINNQTVQEEKIDQLVEDWKNTLNQEAKNATFKYDPETLIVEEFSADENGISIDGQSLKEKILETIFAIETKNLDEESEKKEWLFDLALSSTPAEIQLKDTNDLGINEVIGFGESWYFHSIPTRVFNVSLTAEKMDNIILAPGDIFSFNQALGDVSSKTGYKSAYVIRDGKTELAPGGGVCQVSSTLFRALLDSGLEVTRRLPHSYRVEYYEINNEPGFDATVFSGNTDLRFVNDTDHHILLKFSAQPDDLYMDVKIYGTSDGRQTEVIDYKKWGFTGAPAPQYIPDASLAPGQLKQIDWAVSGIKAEFTNVIKDKNGEIIREDYYYSSYTPWSAKYLQGI